MSGDAALIPAARLPWPRSQRIGLALLALIAVVLIVGPLLVTVDPGAQDLAHSLAPIGSEYLLGADQFGRSSAVRLLLGARLSVAPALLAAASAAVPGTLLGLWAEAAAGGLTDRLLGIVADIVRLERLYELGAVREQAVLEVDARKRRGEPAHVIPLP